MVRDRQAHFSHCSFLALRAEARINSSSGQIVTMMKSAEPWRGDELGSLCAFRSFPGSRCLLVQTKVRPILVVVMNVLIHKAFQMPLIHNDHMVEQFAAAVSDPAFCDTVLPRTAEAGPFRLNAEALHCIDHFRIKAGTTIKDQVARRRIIGKCFTQLLNHPCAGWMSGYVEVQNAAPVMRDDEEAVEYAEGERRQGKEIHCGNCFAVIAQKCNPSLRGLGISRSLSHPAQYGTLGNVEVQHLQLTVNARRAPGWVFSHYAEDQFVQFPADALSSRTLAIPARAMSNRA